MPKGVFKKGFWSFIQKEFNQCVDKNYNKDQLRLQSLNVRHDLFSELIGRLGMGWDLCTKTVIGSEEVWANTL